MKFFILLFVFVIAITIVGCGSTEQRDEIPVDYPIKSDITDQHKTNIENKTMKDLEIPVEKNKTVSKIQTKKVEKVDIAVNTPKKEEKIEVKQEKKEENKIDKIGNKEVKLTIKPDNKIETIHVPGKTTNEKIDIDFDVKGKEYYYLRIISLPKHKYHKKNAMKVKKFLDKKYPDKSIKIRNAKDKKSHEYWVIDIGRFKKLDEKAKKFKKEVQNIRYQKRKDFYSSFFLKY